MDVFFGVKYKVFINFVIGFVFDYGLEWYDMFEVIVYCFLEVSVSIRVKCEFLMFFKMLIRNLLLIFIVINLLYLNSYCVYCNGEWVINFVYWDMGIGKVDVLI